MVAAVAGRDEAVTEGTGARVRADALASLVHELRTPLSAIAGFTALLEREGDGQLTDRERRWVQNIAAAADHMQHLVEDVIELRRLDHVRVVRTEALEVERLLDEAVELNGALIRERRHTVNQEIGEGAALVMAEARPLLQALLNLVANAARFTPPGGTIELRSTRLGSSVILEVQDSGPGIPDEALPHLFDYYATLGAKHRHGFKGPGVGLALTRALVLRMGGSIAVVSVPGQGATFRVALPAACGGAGEPIGR